MKKTTTGRKGLATGCLLAAMLASTAHAQNNASSTSLDKQADGQVWIPRLSLPLSDRLTFQPEPYPMPPEAKQNDNLPHGTLTEHRFKDSQVFPNTNREYWVYVPAQYDPSKPAGVMVFQDGHAYLNDFKAPQVIDQLIAEGSIPVSIALFVEPGHRGNWDGDQPDQLPTSYWDTRNNRGLEYNAPDDAYPKFLIEELIPVALNEYNLSKNPSWWMIAGSSSGGISAFNTAWQRPESFGKVFSCIGSFVNIRGGHDLESQVRHQPNKPIRIFMQDGIHDLDNPHGPWYLANQALAAAFIDHGYDHRFVVGAQGHSGQHAQMLFPDALRWLYRDWKKPIAQVPMPAWPNAQQLPEGLPGVSFALNDQVKHWQSIQAALPKVAIDPKAKPSATAGVMPDCKTYPGTKHRYWLHTPAAAQALIDQGKPVPVAVFLDGPDALNNQHATQVVDALIDQNKMPPVVALFVEFGTGTNASPREQRAKELETFDGQHARFLADELLPFVANTHGLTWAAEPHNRVLLGHDSAGFAAVNACWQAPETFGNAASLAGLFVDLKNGHDLQAVLRKTDAKPIRIWLQDSRFQADLPQGNPWIANQMLAKALAFKKMDHQLVITDHWPNKPTNRRATPTNLANQPSDAELLTAALTWLWEPAVQNNH